MRYRPFGRSGSAVSAITLRLGDDVLARGPGGVRALVYAALEAGINSFHLNTADPVLGQLAGEAFASVDRDLLMITLSLGQSRDRRGAARDFSAEGLTGAIDQWLNVSRMGHIDLALLDEPAEEELPQSALSALKALRQSGRIKMLGVSGESEVMDAYVSTNAFDVLATPFNVNVPWPVRHRMRAAMERDMAVIAYGYYPKELSTPAKAVSFHQQKRGLFGLGGSGRASDTPLASAGTFAFLHETHGWSAEEICLTFTLTDPQIATLMVDAVAIDRLERLAATVERDLPPGLSAQIEMARVRGAA